MNMLPSDLPDLPAWTPIAVDTETSGLHPDDHVQPVTSQSGRCAVSAVSVAWMDGDRCVTLAWPFDQGIRDKLDQGSLLELMADDPNLPKEQWTALLDWLDGRRLVFHNAKFDLAMLRTGTRDWTGRDLEGSYVWDTALGAHILWPRHAIGLKPTAERLGLTGGGERDTEQALKDWIKGAKLGKGIGTKDNPRYDLVPWNIMGPYAAGDTELTIRLYHLQQELLDAGEAMRSRVEREIALSRALYRMEQRGVGFDAERALTQADVIEHQMEQIRRGLPFDPNINGAKRYFFEERGLPPVKTTDKGAPQLDDEVRRIMIERGTKHMDEYDRYVKLGKALSMWYRGWPARVGEDGRLRCTFRQAYVKSGRLSVERVQLQAIPKDDKDLAGVESLRDSFVPRDGHGLWNLDLSQAELRVASRFADCTRMIEMLEAGADLHGVTTQQIFQITKDHPDWKAKRDIAKRLTFGGIFQIGPKTFRETLSKLAGMDWTLEQCKEAVYAWRNLYPEFGYAYNRYDRQAQDRGYVELIGRERSYFGERDYSNSAWNRRVQGSLAKFLKLWLPQVDAQTDGALILTVHDSTVLELPLESKADMYDTGETYKDGTPILVPKLAQEVADHGAQMATEMFGIQMGIDVGPWRDNQKHHKDDDQYEGVK